MNKTWQIGRLVRDCEMRSTQSGIAVCNFTLAVDRRVKKDDPKEADFIDFTAWREKAEFISKYFHKGDPISVLGHIRSDKYTDKDGNNRTKVYVEVDDVEFVPGKRQETGNHQPAANAPAPATAAPSGGGFVEVHDSELPF